jgi:hypothetical protein
MLLAKSSPNMDLTRLRRERSSCGAIVVFVVNGERQFWLERERERRGDSPIIPC